MDHIDEVIAETAMKHAEERSRLRDEFAMAALTGIANGSLIRDDIKIGDKPVKQLASPLQAHEIAHWCYCLADAMLEARGS